MLRKIGMPLSVVVALVVGAVILAGCGSDEEKTEVEFAPPTALEIDGVGTSAIAVEWSKSPDELLSNFEGYLVYWNPGGSLAGMQPSQFPASADSAAVTKTTHSYTVQGLDEGTKYFIHVRAYKSNGDFSRGTNEINASPRPEGTGSIYEKASALENDSAFDLSEGQHYSFVIENASHCDIYLGTVQANDASGDLYLKSPDQVQSSNNWTSRNTQLKDIGFAGDRAAFDSLATTTDSGWLKKSLIIPNHVYAIKTPDNHFAKLWVIGTDGTSPNRTINFTYAYQTVENYASFSPRKP
jgi:hypothetical protein